MTWKIESIVAIAFLLGCWNAITWPSGYDDFYFSRNVEYAYTSDSGVRVLNDLYVAGNGTAVFTLEYESSATANKWIVTGRDYDFSMMWTKSMNYEWFNFVFNSAETFYILHSIC